MASDPQINVVPAIVEDSEDYDGDDFEPDKIPEQLKDECLVNYFRCRYKERPALRAKYEELPKKNERDQRGRIDREISRIKDLRDCFDKTERNKPEIELFRYRQVMVRPVTMSYHESQRRTSLQSPFFICLIFPQPAVYEDKRGADPDSGKHMPK